MTILREPRPPLRLRALELVVPWLPFHFDGVYLALPFCHLILYRGLPSQYLRVHEFAHAMWREDFHRWVMGYWASYLSGMRRGYRRNPHELQARAAQDMAHKRLPEWLE